ncbi:hypothetical protein [Glycomyces artemisiae]|uniref:Ribbon-helix-helix CopG family protein n=1 Tax=Glycomyces artemisiae TaxID=1076443 RepID=A0A2T0UVE1_9ACTN|nr:hypothetical protein [Glycomyces artemisiae]PRY61876.1 hypothetical protein B0I28_101200 [Glycomyces artemisiae]
MTNVLIRSLTEAEVAELRAMAEAQHMSLQAFMADLVRKTIAGNRNRLKLAEIEARLKTMPSATFTVEDVLAAKDAPRRGAE